MTIEELRANLPDQRWRLNNLYHIINEDGKDVLFTMRTAQAALYDNLWYRNIILKARQEGFTTFIDLLALDCAIFTPNYAVDINAETKAKAADIFAKKILYPYKHLPKEIQEYTSIVTETKDGTVTFSNGSSIQVDVSARSGTFQFMHISEYGVVSAKAPGKAEEIQTGSIPAVPKNGFIFIESTAKGNFGLFYEMSEKARKDSLAKKKLSPMEFRFHFFPWHWHKEYRQAAGSVVITKKMLEYFDELCEKYDIFLDEEQQAWYAAQESTLGEKMWSEYPSYPEEAFKVAQEGAYYAEQFTRIYRENRICKVPYDPVLPVYTAWDLGISDDTSIWFLQFFGREIRAIDYYASTGEALTHYIDVVKSKEYRHYGGHFAPHDIDHRELGTGISRAELAKEHGLKFETIPTNRDLLAGIENVREMLLYCYFDEEKCADGVRALEGYRKEWNDKFACFRDRPLHDWTSHGSDAFRTGAVAWRMGLVRNSPPPGRNSSSSKKVKVTGGMKRI